MILTPFGKIPASEGRILNGRTIRGEKLYPESSRRHFFCGECDAYHRLVFVLFTIEVNNRPCSEGVWLSVSPTDDALIVALDFEGGLYATYRPLFGSI